MTPAQKDISLRIIEVLVGILIAISLSLSSWAVLRTVEHESRLQVIESSRFTDYDGAMMERRVEAAMRAAVDEIKDCMNRIQRNQECD